MVKEGEKMSMVANLEKIRSVNHYAVPKQRYKPSVLSEWFIGTVLETPDHWLIPCSHIFNPPTTDTELANLASKLRQDLPAQLRDLLRATNGAQLFRIRYRGVDFGPYWIARFTVYNCLELLQVNQMILDTFLSYAEYDPKYKHVKKLNYLAFCDVHDGNHLAINLEGPNSGIVFFLDHDYGFYPFGVESTREAYIHVADSISAWLEQLITTSGEGGVGGKIVPL